MSWSQVIGHDREKKILQRAIIDGKLAHAYLFQGNEGIGKEALAIEFAKAANCENPLKKDDLSIIACDKCKSCSEINKLSSNNLEFIFPLPPGKKSDSKEDNPYSNLDDSDIQTINEEIQLKAQNNYHKIELPKANQIKISSIRYIKKKLSLSGNTKGRRFVIISEAHNITNEASNAFLKTLEEPHENITIILCTSRTDKILQTIVSRCQVINCSPVSTELIAKYLIDKHNIDETNAMIAAQFGQGSITKSEESLSDNLKTNRNLIVDVLRTSLKKRNFRSELVGKIQNMSKEYPKNEIIDNLKLLMLWIKDGINYLIDNDINNLINKDDFDAISKFADYFKSKDIKKAIYEIEEHIYMIESNVNMNLLLISLFLKIRYIFIDNP